MSEDLSIQELAERILAKEIQMNLNSREQYRVSMALKDDAGNKSLRGELEGLSREEITIYVQISNYALRLAYKIKHEG